MSRAYYFVMTMPYSGCMYVEAFPDMKMPSWIAGHNHAYRFFGGTPAITVPDNMKCAEPHLVFNGAPSVMRSSRA